MNRTTTFVSCNIIRHSTGGVYVSRSRATYPLELGSVNSYSFIAFSSVLIEETTFNNIMERLCWQFGQVRTKHVVSIQVSVSTLNYMRCRLFLHCLQNMVHIDAILSVYMLNYCVSWYIYGVLLCTHLSSLFLPSRGLWWCDKTNKNYFCPSAFGCVCCCSYGENYLRHLAFHVVKSSITVLINWAYATGKILDRIANCQ